MTASVPKLVLHLADKVSGHYRLEFGYWSGGGQDADDHPDVLVMLRTPKSDTPDDFDDYELELEFSLNREETALLGAFLTASERLMGARK